MSKREFLYFLTGLSLGSVIGYSIALNWHTPRHLHSMKAIVCHHYIGIEVNTPSFMLKLKIIFINFIL